MSWTDDALCYDSQTPDAWFPHPTDEQALAEAQAVCALCPVAQACFEAAYDAREKAGVWGGVLFDINSHRNKSMRAALRNRRRKFVESVESEPLSVHTLRRKRWAADKAREEADRQRQAELAAMLNNPEWLDIKEHIHV